MLQRSVAYVLSSSRRQSARTRTLSCDPRAKRPRLVLALSVDCTALVRYPSGTRVENTLTEPHCVFGFAPQSKMQKRKRLVCGSRRWRPTAQLAASRVSVASVIYMPVTLRGIKLLRVRAKPFARASREPSPERARSDRTRDRDHSHITPLARHARAPLCQHRSAPAATDE